MRFGALIGGLASLIVSGSISTADITSTDIITWQKPLSVDYSASENESSLSIGVETSVGERSARYVSLKPSIGRRELLRNITRAIESEITDGDDEKIRLRGYFVEEDKQKVLVVYRITLPGYETVNLNNPNATLEKL